MEAKVHEVFVIAEAGVNHNGSLQRALEMVDAAAAAGANAVKFQTFTADALVTKDAPKASYQQEHTEASESQYDMLKKLELDEPAHRALMSRCEERGIEFMSAAFDEASMKLLADLGIHRIKVASGEMPNVPLLRQVAKLNLPVLLSTGMAVLDEVRASLEVLEDAGCPRDRVTVLHCTTQYPTPLEEVNLLAMVRMREALRVRVGYSDHTDGITVPIAAAALGATVVEKHFTLDKTLPGPDHQASLEPNELGQMVSAIRDIEIALGDGVKRPGDTERANAAVARKSIVAARTIHRGERFSADALTVKRPGTGMSPLVWDVLLERTATRDYLPDEQIDEVLW